MMRLENVLKTSLQDVLKMSWKHFRKTSGRHFQDVLKTSSEDAEEICLQGVFKTFSSRRMFAGKCCKVIFKCGGSYIDSPDWIKNKKAIINPKMRMINVCNMQQLMQEEIDEEHYEEIELHPERVLNIKQLINKYNWER